LAGSRDRLRRDPGAHAHPAPAASQRRVPARGRVADLPLHHAEPFLRPARAGLRHRRLEGAGADRGCRRAALRASSGARRAAPASQRARAAAGEVVSPAPPAPPRPAAPPPPPPPPPRPRAPPPPPPAPPPPPPPRSPGRPPPPPPPRPRR